MTKVPENMPAPSTPPSGREEGPSGIPERPFQRRSPDDRREGERRTHHEPHHHKPHLHHDKRDETAVKEKDKTKKDEKGKDKEKGLEGILAMPQVQAMAAQLGLSPEQLAAFAAKIEPKEAMTNAVKIIDLIQRMCDRMLVGTVEGRQMVMVDLKNEPSVPTFFAGAQMTIAQLPQGGIAVRFSQFTTPMQEMNAIFAVQQNQKALQTLVANLDAKNIALTELQIGSVVVRLPPPPSAIPKAERVESIITSPQEREEAEREGADEGKEER